jgi:hypothetical protein
MSFYDYPFGLCIPPWAVFLYFTNEILYIFPGPKKHQKSFMLLLIKTHHSLFKNLQIKIILTTTKIKNYFILDHFIGSSLALSRILNENGKY